MKPMDLLLVFVNTKHTHNYRQKSLKHVLYHENVKSCIELSFEAVPSLILFNSEITF